MLKKGITGVVSSVAPKIENLTVATAKNGQNSKAAKFLYKSAMKPSKLGEISSRDSDTLIPSTRQAMKQERINSSLPQPKENSKSLVQDTLKQQQDVNNLVHQTTEALSLEMQECISNAYTQIFLKNLADANRTFSTSSCTPLDMKFPKGEGSCSNEVMDQSEKNLVHEQDQNPIIPDREAFRRQAWKCGQEFYRTDKSLEPKRLEVAWTMYQQGLKGSKLGFAVIGRQPLREIDKVTGGEIILPSDEKYPSLDREVGRNFGFMNQSENGSLLRVKYVNSLVMNDAWMLGTIQRPWALEQDDASDKSVVCSDGSTEDLKPDLSPRKSPKDFVTFHFGAPLRWDNFWNKEGGKKDGVKGGRMTILAREVIQLVESGYEIKREHPKLEPVAVCVDPEKARTVSLPRFKESVERYWKKEDLRKFFESLPEEVRE